MNLDTFKAKAAEVQIMKSGPLGPLHGIPIAHKDVYCTKGIPTTAHSKILINHVRVRRLAEAGTVMLGKLATCEFAGLGPSFDLPWPPAPNPWNPPHYTGGSSSGTGAAIAAGLVLGGTGTDTGGSIRSPASLCGVTGFEPTWPLPAHSHPAGRLFARPCWVACLDSQGLRNHVPAYGGAGLPAIPPAPMCRRPISVHRSAARSMGCASASFRHFHELDCPVTEVTRRAREDAASVFRALGAEVVDVTLPPLADWTAGGEIIVLAESYALREQWLAPAVLWRMFSRLH